jgi:uncharacterized membrane protein YeaQ/YmgE (transglycosylase-associated protein family)
MNMHLVFFSIDVISWIFIGIYFGYIVHTVEKNHNNETTICYPVMIIVSILSGLFATLVRALPPYGFAMDIFLEALVGTIVIAALLYKHFREDFFNERRWTI